jgi:hypothetical protein
LASLAPKDGVVFGNQLCAWYFSIGLVRPSLLPQVLLRYNLQWGGNTPDDEKSCNI